MGSRSVVSTITSLYQLDMYRTKWFTLFALWSLSPIAGQASSRILKQKLVTNEFREWNWQVLNTPSLGPWVYRSKEEMTSVALSASYMSALAYGPQILTSSSNKQSGTHSFLRPIAAGTGPVKLDDAWFNLINYSAFAGIPIRPPAYIEEYGGVTPTVNITIDVQLFQFECPGDPAERLSNTTDILQASRSISTDFGFRLMTEDSGVSNQTQQALGVVFESVGQRSIVTWSCSLSPTLQEYVVSCTEEEKLPGPITLNVAVPDFGCQFTEMRSSRATFVDFIRNASFAQDTFDVWSILDPGREDRSSATERFLSDEDPSRYLNKTYVDLSSIDNVTFATRITQAFNTFWILSLLPEQHGPTDYSIEDYSLMVNAKSTTPSSFLPFNIVVCVWPYFTILVVTSLILTGCALASAWLRYRIHSLDVLGYVSSMAIEDQDGKPFNFGSNLDGMARSRAMAEVVVTMSHRPGREAGPGLVLVRGSRSLEPLSQDLES